MGAGSSESPIDPFVGVLDTMPSDAPREDQSAPPTGTSLLPLTGTTRCAILTSTANLSRHATPRADFQ